MQLLWHKFNNCFKNFDSTLTFQTNYKLKKSENVVLKTNWKKRQTFLYWQKVPFFVLYQRSCCLVMLIKNNDNLIRTILQKIPTFHI